MIYFTIGQQAYVKNSKLDGLIQMSKLLLDDMEATRKVVKENFEHVKKINQMATDASLRF